MTVREKMKTYREAHGLTIKSMSRLCDVSEGLIASVEEGWVTHPRIAQRIGTAYKLTQNDIYELMPVIHRPNDPRYDPDYYKSPVDMEERVFNAVPKNRDKMRVENEYRSYQHDHHEKLRRRYG